MFKDTVPRKYRIAGMAIDRKKWVDRVDNFLRGAFGEFIKEKLGKEVGIAYSWSDEIEGLLEEVLWLMDEGNIKRTFKDVGPALLDAYEEAVSGLRLKMHESMNIYLDKYLPENNLISKRDVVRKWTKDNAPRKEDLLYEMLETYAPKLAEKLQEE